MAIYDLFKVAINQQNKSALVIGFDNRTQTTRDVLTIN